jgi:hypothetical protein
VLRVLVIMVLLFLALVIGALLFGWSLLHGL